MINPSAIILIAATMLSPSTPATSAPQVCASRDAAVVQLADHYAESVKGRGLTADGKVMLELFVSKDGSWTLLASDVDGKSCPIAAGEAWHNVVSIIADPA